jgi:dihydrofolate reductase
MIRCIIAIDRKRGLAKHGYMPWNIPDDEAFFTDQTKLYGGNILVGGVTFREAFKSQPLVDRQNYLLTRDKTPVEGITLVHDLDKFLTEMGDTDLWVTGGAKVFEQVLAAGAADELYVTKIDADFGCDQFFPEYEADFQLAQEGELLEENGFTYQYTIYRKRPT